jgi:SAM-dependent methyltransferase
VAWLGVGSGRRWLDVGCGTGALSASIVDGADPGAVLGIDASTSYVADARRRVPDRRARFEAADATALDFRRDFDVAVSGLVLNFLPDPTAVVRRMARAVTDEGIVAAYVWDYAGRMEMLRTFWDVAGELDAGARDLDEGVRFPLCDPARLAAVWADAGLGSVATTAIDASTVFVDFDDYWSPFLGGQGPAGTYVRSRPDRDRDALRDAVRAALPVSPDGSISLTSRAWAVRGNVA